MRCIVSIAERADIPGIGSRQRFVADEKVRKALKSGHSSLGKNVPKDEIATAIARCAGCLADSVATEESIDS